MPSTLPALYYLMHAGQDLGGVDVERLNNCARIKSDRAVPREQNSTNAEKRVVALHGALPPSSLFSLRSLRSHAACICVRARCVLLLLFRGSIAASADGRAARIGVVHAEIAAHSNAHSNAGRIGGEGEGDKGGRKECQRR